MSSDQKRLKKARRNPKGLRFSELVGLLGMAGFQFSRQKGSHQTHIHPDHPELRMTVHDHKGGAVPYQVKQLLSAIEEYGLV